MKIQNITELKAEIEKEALTEHSFENVELKRDWSKEHGEKVSMLCNGITDINCFLVVGIEDNGRLSGQDNKWLESKLEIISQHFNQFLDPTIALSDLTTDTINGSRLIIATVKNPGVVVKWNSGAWVGKGTTKKKLEEEEILELSLKLPGLTDYTKQAAAYIPDEEIVNGFCKMGSFIYDERVLSRFHLNNNKCGQILFGDASFRVIKYDENQNVESNETRNGVLNLLSASFWSEVRTYYAPYFDDTKRISNDLLREAFGNSVGHAAYHSNFGEIIVELHPTNLVISNLAYKEYISLANKWFSNAHKSPNPFLMETLRIIKKVDELGRGKKKLFSECLTNGFEAPLITITDAGRYKRWSLNIVFGYNSIRHAKTLNTLQEYYRNDKEKSLIAFSLVLWNKKPFSEIAGYFDAHESKLAAEIIDDIKGPVFFWKEKDTLLLHRWVKVLIEEGKASKEFTVYEETQLLEKCRTFQTKYNSGYITAKDFREIAHLSNSLSDKSLTSRTLGRWKRNGDIRQISKGNYQFNQPAIVQNQESTLNTIVEAFKLGQKEASEGARN